MPSTVRQCVRMAVTAPSSISPTPRGRSGTIPGLAAGGWLQPLFQFPIPWCPGGAPQPWPWYAGGCCADQFLGGSSAGVGGVVSAGA